jgi:predicted DNA-binding transcriptional regulator AlpA
MSKLTEMRDSGAEYIDAAKVLAYFNVTAMTLYRWRQSAGFPAPASAIMGRNRYRLAEVIEWDETQAGTRAGVPERLLTNA